MLSLTVALSLVAMIFLFFFIAICRIFYAIFFPTIISYPYPPPSTTSSILTKQKQPRKEKTVVFAGSFNPIHMGHLAMIQQYIIRHYSKVIIVIGTNPHKKYEVSAKVRANLIRKVIRQSNNKFMIQNIMVQVVSNDYIWRIVRRQGASLFVRGIRTWEQDGRDEQKLQFQNIYGPIILGPLWFPMPTIFIQGMPQYNHVSSTYLRKLIQQYTATDQDGGDDTSREVKENEEETSSKPQPKLQQQKQKDQLYQVLRQKLIALVPEAIVDDVIQLYGHRNNSHSSSTSSSMVVIKDKAI